MTAEGDKPPFGVTEEELQQYEQVEAARREEYQRGNAFQEVLRSSTRPETIRSAARKTMESYEDPTSYFFHDKYSLAHAFRVLEDRKNVFTLTNDDLDSLGIKQEKIAGFAMRVKEDEVEQVKTWEEMDNKGEWYKKARKEKIKTQIPEYGTNDERKTLAKAMEEAQKEMIVRWEMNEWYGAYQSSSGSLGKLSELFLNPYFANMLYATDFKRLFSLPAIAEVRAGKPELTSFGDKIDRGIRAYLLVGKSEDPISVRWLKMTPGWKLLFSNDQEERDFLGDITSWKDRLLENGTLNPNADFTSEIRGKLTSAGNIFNKRENEAEREGIRGAVRELLGGDASAEELAWRMFQLFGLAAECGGAYYSMKTDAEEESYGRYEIKPSVEGFPASDDLTKLFHFEVWRLKQKGNGHDAGPEKTLVERKYPINRFLVNFLSFVELYNEKNEKGKGQVGSRRSFYELWWKGYANNAYRLGQLPWEKVNMESWRDFLLRVFMAGREGERGPGGIVDKLVKVDWTPEPLVSPKFWKDFTRDLNVVVNAQLITGGFFENTKAKDIKTQVSQAKKAIINTWWEGIKSLPQYQEWKTKSIDKMGVMGKGTQNLEERIREIANAAGVQISK
jgi:hypothetical protein